MNCVLHVPSKDMGFQGCACECGCVFPGLRLGVGAVGVKDFPSRSNLSL